MLAARHAAFSLLFFSRNKSARKGRREDEKARDVASPRRFFSPMVLRASCSLPVRTLPYFALTWSIEASEEEAGIFRSARCYQDKSACDRKFFATAGIIEFLLLKFSAV